MITAETTPMTRSMNMAGTLGFVRRRYVTTRAMPARSGADVMRWTPSTMKESPRPSMMPRTTGFVASLEIGLMAPVAPARSQKRPVVRPDANRAAGLMPPATAAAPMAFMGWIGSGVR